MEVIKLEKGNNFPIKAMPEETRAKKVLELGIWLSKLLSLKDDVSMERLEVLLPMVSDYCWSMTIEDIKKAFQKYVKSELPNLEPRTNFLDVILFGKVIKAYKETRILKPKELPEPKITETEKEKILKLGVERCESEYKEYGMVFPGNQHIYDYLYEKGILKVSNERKKKSMIEANVSLKKQSTVGEKFVRSEGKTISEAKRILLEEYFENKKSNQ